MTGEIRIYVEGGGDHKSQKQSLRGGLDSFFASVKDAARSKNINWRCIPCGGRNSAHDDFLEALKQFPDSAVILLVDSEGEVNNSPKDYLTRKEPHWTLSDAKEEDIHLMVQTMEAWFMADKEKFKDVFGPGFKTEKLSGRQNIEAIPKLDLKDKIQTITRTLDKRKEYNEIIHGTQLLELIDPEKVRKASPHCDRLFKRLEDAINSM